MLLHYIAKIECSTVQLCSTLFLFNANVMQSFIYSICLALMLSSVLYVYTD